ncbi:MAG TPA: HEAT repeat domain-containing protein, partial [Nitrospiraceae bacterium]|nr:HEAT repeat domain-containing protein [Nitrospiraceae bacterium]
MPVPRAFKTDESFLEKIAIGATGTRRIFSDLKEAGHNPIELERGSMSFKIWKAIKIKRVRVPDILCLRCGRRVESRAKTKLELSMSHSLKEAERGWDFGLEDEDRIAFVQCQKSGEGPVDWRASSLVQYAPVASMRAAWRAKQAKAGKPKGRQEGFEVRVTWPSAIALEPLVIENVTADYIRYRTAEGRRRPVRLKRKGLTLQALVAQGEQVEPGRVVASVVAVTSRWPCLAGASLTTYFDLARSASLADRYTAVKALGRFPDQAATEALLERIKDDREHIYVRVDAAAGLARRGHPAGLEFLTETLRDEYLENRLEAAIILGEVATPNAADLLVDAVRDSEQHPEIRAGAAWALGEIGAKKALPVLVDSFAALDLPLKIEAARALSKLARKHLPEVLKTFSGASPEQRPGVAWALGKAGGFTVAQLVPTLVDEDARSWVA